MKKRSILTSLLAVTLGSVLVANAADAQEEGGGDLIIADMSDLVSLDPHGNNDVPSSNVRANIYDTLTILDENMEVQPHLAVEWEETDENTYSFTLRDDVVFHDGTEFNAEVVRANLLRVTDENFASQRAFLYEMITDIEVVDDYTVEITTEYPFAPLLSHLAHDAGGMLSLDVITEDYNQALEGTDYDYESYVEALVAGEEFDEDVVAAIGENIGEYAAQNPIGTGPFVLESRSPGDNTVLVRNDDYFDEPALLDSVTFKVVSETASRIAELEGGYSHVIGAVDPISRDRVENHDETYLDETESMSLSYVGFNVEAEYLDDPLVRQAISYAIDREAIIAGIYDGVGIEAIGPLAPAVFGYDENVEGITYDMDRAKELMAEAGYEDGFEISLWTNDNPQRVDTAVFMQESLAELNIDVSIEQVEWGAYLERTADGEHDMFILGWSVVTGDADYGMYPLFHSEQVGAPGNRSFIQNDELDELLEAGRQAIDPDERLEHYSAAQDLLVDLAPMVYIHHSNYLTGVRDEVQGFEINALGIYQLKDVSISAE
ncbi:glutathione ABC transporter substrate-binding protein [Aliicoccus persicus]|uniref:Peptide/nickel transport system substrate-binding protein n=1 Tax=Aliicoccus persicus TaxID=930138 RepID=A0A662Z6I4_9STAP|nr:glutathione ABC transporter substrate-binding protein [Aliicoccus persicus]SEW10574.1 peptide/nickel transport system substrate-binding protein [Aliicoccus persicus]